MTLLPSRLVREFEANDATDTVKKALEGMRERAASIAPKPVYQPRPEPEPDIPQAPVQPVMRAPVAEPEPPPRITLPSTQEIISGPADERGSGALPDVSTNSDDTRGVGSALGAPARSDYGSADTNAGYAPTSPIGDDGDTTDLQPITLPSTQEITGIEFDPEPAPSPLTTLGGTPEAEALTQPGGTASTAASAESGDPMHQLARNEARRAGVDPDVFERQIQQESGFNPRAGSPAGALGIAQIVPRFHPGVDPYDPAASLRYAADLMASNLKKYGGDYAKALAAYNAGPGAVDKYGGVPPFQETQRYVKTILGGGPAPTLGARDAAVAGSGGQLPAPGQSTSAAFDAQSIAKQWEGKKYVFGGAGGRGAGLADTDCSGFVAQITGLPAHTDAAYNALKQRGAGAIEEKEAAPGDIVFYMGGGTGGAITHHMGIYAGPGKVLDMSTAGGGGVNIRPISHGGKFEILRDPANPKTPAVPPTAAPPPEIVPTPVESGGEKPTQSQINQWSEMATETGKWADTIKGVPVAQALQSGNVYAQRDFAGDYAPREDVSGQADIRQGGEDYGVQGASDSDGAGQPGAGVTNNQPPPRDIRGDYGPAPVEPGDFAMPNTPGGGVSPSGVGDNTNRGAGLAPQTAPILAEPVAVEPTPPAAPAAGNIPWHEQVAQSVSSAVSSALQNVFGGGQKPDLSIGAADIQNRAGAVSAPGEPSVADAVQGAVDTFARGRENPSPSQQIANAATSEAGKVLNEGRINWQNVASDVTGGLVPEATSERTEQGIRPARQESIDIAGNYLIPTHGMPEVRGLAAGAEAAMTQMTRLQRQLDDAVRAGDDALAGVLRGRLTQVAEAIGQNAPLPSGPSRSVFGGPSAGIVSRAQADEAAQAATAGTPGGFLSSVQADEAIPIPPRPGSQEIDRLRPVQLEDGSGRWTVADGRGDYADEIRGLPVAFPSREAAEAATVRYERESYNHTPSSPRPTVRQDAPGMAGRAVGSGIGTAYNESQQEGATPESILEAGVAGALTSAGRSAAGIGLRPGGRGAGMVARAVQEGGGEPRDFSLKRNGGLYQVIRGDGTQVFETSNRIEALNRIADLRGPGPRPEPAPRAAAAGGSGMPPEPPDLTVVPPTTPQGRQIPRQDRAAELSRPITLTTEEEIARIRPEMFPADIRDDVVQAAKDSSFGKRLRRGVLGDEEVQQLAQEYAPTVDSAIAGSRRGRAYNAEEIVGLRNLMVNQTLKTQELARDLADNGFDVVKSAQLAAEQGQLRALGDVVFGGAPAEAGRALRQFQKDAQDITQNPADAGLRYLKKQYGTLDKAEEAMSNYLKMVNDGADPVALVDFLRNAKGDWINRLGILRYASMLSSTTTHAINATGNAIKAGVALTDKALMAGIDVGRSKVTGGEREVFASELGAQMHGMASGAIEGARNAGFIMKNGFRPDDITRMDHLQGGFGTNIPGIAPQGSRAAGAVDFAMEAPLRALSAADAIFRGMAEGGHLAAEATAAAIKAGRDEGGRVSADVLREFMTKPAIMDRVQELAARDVLQESRPLTNWIMQSRALPGPQRAIVEAAIPFVRTPFNLMAQGLEMTPLGVVRAVREAKAGNVRGAENAVAEMAVGTAVMAVASWQNMNGNLTGPRPESEAERSTLPPGWQPWSFRTSDDQGNAKYYPMAILGPLAVPAVVAILGTEAAKKGDPIDPAKAALGVGQYFVDQTFFRGISDLAGALSQGGNKIENYIESVSTQYSPHVLGGGALGRQIQQITGQPLRDPHGPLEALLATHPATAGQVPERRDVIGRPVVNAPGGLETALSPIRSSVERDEPVIAAYRRAGEGLPMAAPKQVRDPMRPERRIDLTREQQERWRVVFGAELQNQWRQAGSPRDVRELRRIEQAARDAASERVVGVR